MANEFEQFPSAVLTAPAAPAAHAAPAAPDSFAAFAALYAETYPDDITVPTDLTDLAVFVDPATVLGDPATVLGDPGAVLADLAAVVGPAAPAEKKKKVQSSIRKKQKKVKLSPTEASVALMLYREFNIDEKNDGKDYAVEVVDTFYIGKTRMSLIYFVGYHPRRYARIIPTAQLRKLCT